MYRAEATATGGREGHVKSDDGVIDMDMRPPGKEGETPAGNPEQLFAAGYAACFCGALNLAALQRHMRIADIRVTVSVGIGKSEESGFLLDAVITAHIPGVERKTAEELIAAAENICPYSKATRGNINTVVNAVTE